MVDACVQPSDPGLLGEGEGVTPGSAIESAELPMWRPGRDRGGRSRELVIAHQLLARLWHHGVCNPRMEDYRVQAQSSRTLTGSEQNSDAEAPSTVALLVKRWINFINR